MNTQSYFQCLTSLDMEDMPKKNTESIEKIKSKIGRNIKKRKSAVRGFA